MLLRGLNRWKAATVYLGLSATIAALIVGLMLLVWYPWPYFEAMGGEKLILLMVGVDVVLGPIIVLIIFNPAKKIPPTRSRAHRAPSVCGLGIWHLRHVPGTPGLQRLHGRPFRSDRGQSNSCRSPCRCDTARVQDVAALRAEDYRGGATGGPR